MPITPIRYSERPELWDRIADLSAEVWPEYNLHGEVTSTHWSQLYERFPDYQFVLYDSDTDDVLAEGQTVPCVWDGQRDHLGPGIDRTILEAIALHEIGGRANTLSALAAAIPPRNRQRRLATVLLTAMIDIARTAGFTRLIAPVRPNWKDRYPITPIERYARWRRPDGSAFDPWIRVHLKLGATLGPAIPQSLHIAGAVVDWQRWTGMWFPETGDYVFPGGLAPLHIDGGTNSGEYWEPNVWIIHTLPGSQSAGVR